MLKANMNTIVNSFCKIENSSDKTKSVAFSRTCWQRQANINIDKEAGTSYKKTNFMCSPCARENICKYLGITLNTETETCKLQSDEIGRINALEHTKFSEVKHNNLLPIQNPEDHSLPNTPVNNQASADISARNQEGLLSAKHQINSHAIADDMPLIKNRIKNLDKTIKGVLFYKDVQEFNKKSDRYMNINTRHIGYRKSGDTILEINISDEINKNKLGMAQIYVLTHSEGKSFIELGSLDVNKDYRRCGIGSIIIEQIIEIAALNNKVGIWVEYIESQDNEISDAKLCNFYRKNHFNVAESKNGYKYSKAYLTLTKDGKVPTSFLDLYLL